MQAYLQVQNLKISRKIFPKNFEPLQVYRFTLEYIFMSPATCNKKGARMLFISIDRFFLLSQKYMGC